MVTEPTPETPVVAETAPPVAPPVEPSQEVETPGDAPESEEEAPAVVERSWETVHEEVQGDEGLKADYDAHITEIKREEQSATQKKLQPLFEQADATARESKALNAHALQSGSSVLKKLMDMDKNGGLAEGELTQLLTNEFAPFVRVMVGLENQNGWFDGMNWAMYHGGEHFESPEIAQSHRERLKTAQDAGQSEEIRKMILNDWLDESMKAEGDKREEKGYQRGLKEVNKAAVKVAVADKRAGAGPDGATGAGGVSTSSQQRLDRLALGRDSDGNAPTAEDRAWLAARQ